MSQTTKFYRSKDGKIKPPKIVGTYQTDESKSKLRGKPKPEKEEVDDKEDSTKL